MALQDFYLTGAYSVVENIIYSKKLKQVLFEVLVYSDKTKSTLITCLTFDLSFVGWQPHCIDEEGNRVEFVDGDYIAYDLNNVEIETGPVGEIQAIDASDKTYDFDSDGIPTNATEEFRAWELYFKPEKMTENIQHVIYTYLKTRPEFENAVDA